MNINCLKRHLVLSKLFSRISKNDKYCKIVILKIISIVILCKPCCFVCNAVIGHSMPAI